MSESILARLRAGSPAAFLSVSQLRGLGLHSVSFTGTVRAMHVFPPLPVFESDRCSRLYGVAQFELVDETGSLPVEALGSCFAAAAELPHDGDFIELTAEIQDFVPEGQRQRVIKAITQKIVVLKVAPLGAPAP